jgi:Asp-tRNA(Asn)/Glu-tRNA(Gln) amidotransferase C subunit
LAQIFDNKTIREAKDAHVTAVSTLAELKISTGNQGEAQTELEAIEKDLDDLSTADSSVYAAYYKARATLFKVPPLVLSSLRVPWVLIVLF